MFSLLEKIRGDRKGWYKVSDLVVGMEIAVPTESALALDISSEDDILWDEIVSIKHVGREQVWDIEVEGTHNFVGNDIFAHNTYLLRADPFADAVSIGSNLGIGLASGSTAMEKLEVAGNVLARGFITDSAADVAENYATADSSINAGDVVQLDSAGNLVKSNKAYAPVLGVISTTPGLLLDGKSTTTKAPLALSGRVPVKVTNENGNIVSGDRLTSSATKPGYAMKATEAGMTLGLALEAFSPTASSSDGKIMIFINLSWQAGTLATNGSLQDDPVASSSSSNIQISSGVSLTDILTSLTNTVVVRFQNIWASGDIIAQGLRKTYYSFADIAIFKDLNVTSVVAGWLSREVTIDNTAPDEAKSLFTGTAAQAGSASSLQAAEQSKIDLKEESNGSYLATYGVDSTRGEIQLSGSSDLVNGEARIFFDYSFSSIISGAVPLRVMITPTTPIQGQLYVATKTQYGFVVKELNSTDVGKFDWLVIARRKGYENGEGISPSPSTSPLPSATPVVSPSDTPVPSDTPSESPVSTPPIDTPLPSDTPIPSVTPSATLVPSDSPTPSDTPAPTP